MTDYLIFREVQDSEGSRWNIVGAALAESARAAIRGSVDGEGGTFVAVPKRSWQPATVSIEKAVKFS